LDKPVIVHKVATTTSKISIIKILKCKTPHTMRIGRITRIISDIVGLPSRSKFSFGSSFKPSLQSKKKIANVKAEIAAISGTVDKGLERPNISYKILTNRPKNIIKAILKVTEKTTVSKRFIALSLKRLKIANPGIKHRKMKTTSSLKIGMSSKTEIIAKEVINGITRVFLIFDINLVYYIFCLLLIF
jgi:hypothetical protein